MRNRHWQLKTRWIVLVLVFLSMAGADAQPSGQVEQGLIGAYYGEPDLTRIKLSELLPDLNRIWNDAQGTGHGSLWSGYYEGFITGPVDGEITFVLQTNQSALLEIGTTRLQAPGNGRESVATISMQKDKPLPITVTYKHTRKGRGYLRVTWRYGGGVSTPIPAERLYFTQAQAEHWNHVIESDPASVDPASFTTVPARHVNVFKQPGRFGGWPANNGIWSWGEEIVVGFISGYYLASDQHHSIDQNRPQVAMLARSMDGGETWTVEDPENYVGDRSTPISLDRPVKFDHPDFAMRCKDDLYFISYDRCRTWSGPFQFPGFGREKLTARTDYMVQGEKECLVFLSTEEKMVEAQLKDWAFCAKTTDGGRSFTFQSWMAEPGVVRSVMPSTVRLSPGHLVTALRRRHDQPFADRPPKQMNWLDLYESKDDGKSWNFLSKVAETDRGTHNGNPPCLIKLADGRLCVTYAYRSVPLGIRARISGDQGKTWGEELHLRDDARTWDIGYTRSVQRPDGKIVTIYYYTTGKETEQHIAATIWEAPAPAAHSSLPAMDAPVVYTGDRQPDKRYYDGLLPHAVGVHSYQAFRANRRHPAEEGKAGWTYNHQPYLAYWQGRFYYQYLSDLVAEHDPPGRTLLMTSENGRTWSDPVVLFPEYELPEIKGDDYIIPAGTKAVMHQRMGFYVAPNGRLLTCGFYGYCATPRHSPNAGNGLGRVVREIYQDGSFGPIYFIRYNRHAGFDEKNTTFPFYERSKDEEFKQACAALLADPLMTLQWWEEDRGKDGFFAIDPSNVADAARFSAKVVTSAGAGKAFCWYHRADGQVVGLWKNQYSALSSDNGKSWSAITQNKTLWTCGAKTWGQRTEDGHYAIVHNQSATRRNRFPMVVMTGTDGHIFDQMFSLGGSIPARRYRGIHKNIGTQYFRGIAEGNGNPPGDEMWLVYSMNKEDLWISRVRVPIVGQVQEPVAEKFDAASEADLACWNLYIPRWAPVSVVPEGSAGNRVLQLQDEEPWDYAQAERIFPANPVVRIDFRFNAKVVPQGHALEIEVQDQRGGRPMSVQIDNEWLSADHRKIDPMPVAIQKNRWYSVRLELSCEKQSYDIYLDGKLAIGEIPFAERVESLERIVFRTGPYRGMVLPDIVETGVPAAAGLESEDLPGADEKAPLCRYWIDDLYTQ
jgi:hypothetical protein